MTRYGELIPHDDELCDEVECACLCADCDEGAWEDDPVQDQ